MKISELIEWLEKNKAEWGDSDIVVRDPQYPKNFYMSAKPCLAFEECADEPIVLFIEDRKVNASQD